MNPNQVCDLESLPEPDACWFDLRAELLLQRRAIEAMRRELVLNRLLAAAAPPPAAPPPAAVANRNEDRDRLVIDLAAEIGLGRTWAGAQRITDLWHGEEAPEPATAQLVEDLRAWPPLSQRQIWRLLSDN